LDLLNEKDVFEDSYIFLSYHELCSYFKALLLQSSQRSGEAMLRELRSSAQLVLV